MSDTIVPNDYLYDVIGYSMVDGDTVDMTLAYTVTLDIGFHVTADHFHKVKVRVRLDGWDTPEKRQGSSFERQEARAAEQMTQDFLQAGMQAGSLTCRTRKEKSEDDFSRWFGTITSGVDGDLGAFLAAADLATVWPQRWHEKFDPNRDKKATA